MALITVPGASGDHTVQVTVDGCDSSALLRQAQSLADQLKNAQSDLDSRYLTSGSNVFNGNRGGYGAITTPGSYQVSGNPDWLSVGSDSHAQPGQALDGFVTVDARKVTTENLNFIGGTKQGIHFLSTNQNGTFLSGSGNNLFDGGNGNWKISTGDGNDTINSGNGNNTISAGAGNNVINLGDGWNYVHSDGQDTITASSGTQNITLNGASSTVNVGDQSLVVDNGSNQSIKVGNNSTVIGGVQDNITLNGAYGTVSGGESGTISAGQGNFVVAQTKDADINIAGNLTFLHGTGETTVTAGQSTIFGAAGLDLHLNSTSGTSLFVATIGNQTLDGASSAFGIHAFGSDYGATTQTFIGGSASDTLVAGTGNATLTGGSGAANVFGFRNGVAGSDYTITDFGSAAGNSVLLVHYDEAYLKNRKGYTKESFQQVLDSASHQNGNTTITLSDNSRITFVGVDKLTIDQFSGF